MNKYEKKNLMLSEVEQRIKDPCKQRCITYFIVQEVILYVKHIYICFNNYWTFISFTYSYKPQSSYKTLLSLDIMTS